MMFFPSGMTLYWVVVAGLQLGITMFTRSTPFRRFFKVDRYLPGTILHKQHMKQEEADTQFRFIKRISHESSNKVKAKVVSKPAVTEEVTGKIKVSTDAGSKVDVFSHKPRKH